MMYEMARERIAELHRMAEQHRIAEQAREQRASARGRRASARGRRASDVAETAVKVTIPDFADEMFCELRDAVPAQGKRGRHAGSGR